jgi:ketosteroid isomerase-like protein
MEAADVLAVMAVQNAYGVAIDRRDWAALRECFTSDAEFIKFGRPPRQGSINEFIEWAPAFHADYARTLHQMTTHQVSVHGDAASGSCYLHAVLVDAARQTAESVFGRYTDEFVRDRSGWRIRRRKFDATWWHVTMARS